MTFDEFLNTDYAEAAEERASIKEYCGNMTRIEAEIQTAREYTIRYGFLAKRSYKPENIRDNVARDKQYGFFEE